jgi:2-oxoglutarate dehydrogenase E2 component (dihydrolipoamide succinyltransferase)
MPTEIIMPQMGESIFEGTITKWLKAVGDTVAIDEPLFEISTDKVDAEIPSSVAGVLAEIRFPEGATVEVNTVVGIIGEAGSKIAAPARAAKSAIPQAPPKAQAAASSAGAPEVPALSVAAGRRIRS